MYPDNSYFQNAMAFMRANFSNPHFFVATDDYEWCAGQKFFNTADVTVLNTQPEDFALDFATLVESDGVILSVGSFGWWGGFFAEQKRNATVVYYVNEKKFDRKMKWAPFVKSADYFPKEWWGLDNPIIF